MSSSTSSRPPWFLFGLGVVMLGLLAAVSAISSSFAYETAQITRPVPAVLGLFWICFAIHLAAVYFGLRSNSRYVGHTIVVFAVAFRVVLLFSLPIQEIDIYRYIWDGQVGLTGVSPFEYSPAQVLNSNPFEVNEDLAKLRGIYDDSVAKRQILERIHFGEVSTVYPPVSQTIFRLAAVTTPQDASFNTHLVVMKFWIVVFDVTTILAIWMTLRLVELPVAWLAVYAWCPLVLKEFANSGHLDSIAVCLATVAIALVAYGLFGRQLYGRQQSSSRQTVPIMFASVLLALGVGAKLFPVALTPLLGLTVWKRRGLAHALVAGILFAVTAAVCLAPLMNVERSSNPVPPGEITEIHDPSAGLKLFLSRWMMNDLIFLNLVENVTPDRLRDPEAATPWFVVIPNAIRETVVSTTTQVFRIDETQAPFHFARTITATIFLVLAGWFAYGASNASSAKDWFEYVFLTMAWFWLLLPTLNPWYWTWALPWIAFTKNRVWLLMSGLLFIYYLRFHIGAHFDGQRVVSFLPYQGETFFDYVVVWFEHLPWFVALGAAFAFRMRFASENTKTAET